MNIIVKWEKEDSLFQKAMRVIYSDHSGFAQGTRFDLGFFQIADIEGYTIISLPMDEENSK